MRVEHNLINRSIEQGIEQGIEKVAKKMLKASVPVNTIRQYTGLTVEDIQQLIRQLRKEV